MKNLIILFIAFLIFIIGAFLFFKSKFEEINKVDKFNETEFINTLKNKNIIICGNSPKFPESFKKVKDIPNKFIIRFNTVLDHIDDNNQTDVLFISKELLENNSIGDFNKWKRKCKNCKIYYIESLLKNNNKLNEIVKEFPLDFTSGFITVTYLLNHTPNITLVGFDLPDDYNSPANWYRNNSIWTGHDINVEKQLLSNLLKKEGLIKI